MGYPKPTAVELDEFRTALAMVKAGYRQDRESWDLLTQLVRNPDMHMMALRAIIQCLLQELDTEKRDASDVLLAMTEHAATIDSR